VAALLEAPATVSPRGVTCLYFDAPAAPVAEPVLVLDGEGRGPVLNLAVMSNVSRLYAPPGRHLVACVVMGTPAAAAPLEADVRRQMTEWFGSAAVDAWRHLRTYRIPWAQFDQSPGRLDPPHRPVRRAPGLYACGDYLENASINGAMAAGRRAAEAIVADRRQGA
jgi:hypothetical protein